jgi:hypothetical protein
MCRMMAGRRATVLLPAAVAVATALLILSPRAAKSAFVDDEADQGTPQQQRQRQQQRQQQWRQQWRRMADSRLCLESQGGLALDWVDDRGNAFNLHAGIDGRVSITADNPESAGWSTATGRLYANVLNMSFTMNGPDSDAEIFGHQETVLGFLFSSCERISWGNSAHASHTQVTLCPFNVGQGPCTVQTGQQRQVSAPCCRWQAVRPQIKKLHLVYMTHFDLSCTDQRSVICNEYFNSYFPLYATTASELRALDHPSGARLRYTTWPWLVEELFNATAQCATSRPNATTLALVKEAIRRGDIVWEGKALNLNPELCDGDTFAHTLSQAARLNQHFGTGHGRAAAKSADVAGLSRSVVPYLAAAGMKMLHIGWNAQCSMPALPPTFRWRVNSSEILTLIADTYGDITLTLGWDQALLFDYSSDNRPPPTADVIIAYFESLRHAYPNAEVALSTLDDYAEELSRFSAANPQALPVVTQELGDSWLNLVGSDPWKAAAFRAIIRTIRAETGSGNLPKDDPSLHAYLHRLVGASEHNQGFGTGHFPRGMLSRQGNWSNQEFEAVRTREDYEFLVSSWVVGRDWLKPVSSARPISSAWQRFLNKSKAALAQLQPSRPAVVSENGESAWTTLPRNQMTKVQVCANGWMLQLNHSGAVESLRHSSHYSGLELGPAAVYRCELSRKF